MLKPKEIETLPDSLIELYSRVEQDILADMARRINAYDYWIPSVEWQYKKMIEMGNFHSYVTEALASRTAYFNKEIERLMQEASSRSLKFDVEIYKQHGLNPAPIAASESLRRILNAGLKETKGTFKNITKTTANTATKQFEDALDRAWLQITSGAFDRSAATRMAIKDVARQGIGAIKYPSGHIDTIEVATTRAIRTGVNKTCLKLQWELADEMECDLVEVSAHAGARPDHAEWQGKVYSRSGTHPKYPDFEASTGYGTGAGLGGWNCRHSFYPYFEGSPRAYSKQELDDFEAKNYEYNDHKMTEYEATQQQRYIERKIRRWKRQEASGVDVEQAQAKIRKWQGRQRDFLEQTGLKRQWDREQIAKVRRIKGLAAHGASPSTKSVPKFVGKIDFMDSKLIESKLREFRNSVAKESIEHAFVILGNGKAYRLAGSAAAVNPEILGSALKGAIISHNHPFAETEFSFSNNDFDLFQKYKLSELRGFDEKYSYVLNRGMPQEAKFMLLNDMNYEDFQHYMISVRAAEEGVFYERLQGNLRK